jgi:hypothetical protein
MCSKTVFQSTREIPSGLFGVGLPVLLFWLLGAGLIATFLTPGSGPVWAANGLAARAAQTGHGLARR